MSRTRLPLILCSALIGMGLLYGCSEKPAPYDATAEYSNLTDKVSREELSTVMSAAGISQDRQELFFGHVDQFNAVLPPDALTSGYLRRDIMTPLYDPYRIQALWDAAYPDFPGYNCRITAYGLFGDLVEVPVSSSAVLDDSPLFMDLASLDADPSAFPDDPDGFRTLYASVPTADTKDIQVHAEAVRKEWEARGIRFQDNPDVSLISMFFHDMLEEGESTLWVGHTGVLFRTRDDALLFVEKLAFQEPYQCVRFRDRTELSNYLMTKYDLDEGQPMASPFIMENDHLMDGYGPKPDLK